MAFACLLLLAAQVELAAASSAPSMGVVVQAEPNPLQKVVKLLQEMKLQVEKDGEADSEAYAKYSCWCATNEKQKTEAIAEAERRIQDLASFLTVAVQTEAQLKTEIQSLAADIAEDQDALDTAIAVREKENSAFLGATADMNETLVALTQAIDVLSKLQLVQKRGDDLAGRTVAAKDAEAASEALVQVGSMVKRHFPHFKEVVQRDLFDVLGSLQEAAKVEGVRQTSAAMGAALVGEVFLPKREALALEQEATSVDAGEAAKPNDLQGAAAGAKSYNSRSGSIFGLLSEMKDQFARDVASAMTAEAQAAAIFAQLKEAKLGEIASATQQKKQKEGQLTALLVKVATSKEDMAALEEARAADEKFLADLKQTCATEAQEFKERTTARNEEIRAIGETLKILTEDEARDLFGKTMSFLQVSSKESPAERASRNLRAVARKHKSLSLASLANSVSLDSFAKVTAMMDQMVADLKAQQKDEYEKAEYCKKEIDKTEDEIKVSKNEQEDLAESHKAITNSLSELADDIAKLKADIAASEVSLKQAGEARKTENEAFIAAQSDQRATIEILHKAVARLEAFYASGAELVQVNVHRQQQEPGAASLPPPPKPSDYQKSAAAGGALQLMQKIITDAQVVEAELEATEQNAQAAYGALVKDMAASIQANRDAIAEKEAAVAAAEGEKSATEESQLANEAQIATFGDLLGARHADCDWLLKYFDVRQQARQEEMDAIKAAKAILSGADLRPAATDNVEDAA